MATDHYASLKALIRSQPEAKFAFVGDSSGKLLAESGNTKTLSSRDVVTVSMTRDQIQSWHHANKAYEKEGPRLVPRMYGQGDTVGIMARPYEGLTVCVFGEMPKRFHGKPEKRAAWMSDFRSRVWDDIQRAFEPIDG